MARSTIAALIAWGASVWPVAFAERLPLPAAAAQRKAEATIREVFDLGRAKTAAECLDLARKLRDAAQGTNDDRTAQFVLFRLASESAAEGGIWPRPWLL